MPDSTNSQPDKPETAMAPVRQWRVGTLSMGLSLVALGAVLLLGRFNDSFTLGNLLKLWPLILIILGLEMVIFNLLTVFKGGRVRFTYDFLSIFLVLLILFSSTGLIALESSGVLNLAQRSLRISQRHVESEKLVYAVDVTLETLVLNVERAQTTLRSYEGKEIKISIVYNGYFSSWQEANEYAQEQLVRSQRVGDSLFVQVYPPNWGHLPNNIVDQEVTVLIPHTLAVELSQDRGAISINLEQLQSNWLVSLKQPAQGIELILNEPDDLVLKAELSASTSLWGNLEWDSKQESDPPDIFRAEKLWGQGSYSLTLRQDGGIVEINTR